MSSLEIKARNSYAISALNNLRHKINDRPNDFSEEHKALILESIKLLEEPTHFNEYFSYSIHGLSNVNKSSAVQLSDAFDKSIPSDLSRPGIQSIKEYLTNDDSANINSQDLVRICNNAINYLSNRENSSGNIFITYDI